MNLPTLTKSQAKAQGYWPITVEWSLKHEKATLALTLLGLERAAFGVVLVATKKLGDRITHVAIYRDGDSAEVQKQKVASLHRF